MIAAKHGPSAPESNAPSGASVCDIDAEVRKPLCTPSKTPPFCLMRIAHLTAPLFLKRLLDPRGLTCEVTHTHPRATTTMGKKNKRKGQQQAAAAAQPAPAAAAAAAKPAATRPKRGAPADSDDDDEEFVPSFGESMQSPCYSLSLSLSLLLCMYPTRIQQEESIVLRCC